MLINSVQKFNFMSMGDANMLEFREAALQGIADWQGLVCTDEFEVLSAYGTQAWAYALPAAAKLSDRPDGVPHFFLEFFSDRNSPGMDDSLYAMLEMGLEQDPGCAGLAAGPGGKALVPLALACGSYFQFECAGERACLPFVWTAGRRAVMRARLTMETARLLYAVLGSGSIAQARAGIECEVAALLPRPDIRVHFEPAQALAVLQQQIAPGGASVPFQALVSLLQLPPAGVFRIEGEEAGARGLGLAIAGRLRHHFGHFIQGRSLADGPHVRLDAGSHAPGPVCWDLRTPLLASVPVFLRCDPFGPLADGLSREQLVAFTSVPELPDQLRTRRVTVGNGLPAHIVNCERIELDIRVERTESESGAAQAHTLVLYPAGAQSIDLDLHYARLGSAKPYSARVRVVDGSGLCETAWRRDCEDFLFVDPGWLPMGCVVVSASSDLLAEAVIRLELLGAEGTALLSAELTEDLPEAAMLPDAAGPGARLRVSACHRADPSQVLVLHMPCCNLALDKSLFPGYGPQSVPVELAFGEGVHEVLLEFAPEDPGAEPVLLRFSSHAPRARFSYFSSRLFACRYRYRRLEGDAREPGTWSGFLPPGQLLCLSVSSGRHDGKPFSFDTWSLPMTDVSSVQDLHGIQAGPLFCIALGVAGDQAFVCLPGEPEIESADGAAKAALLRGPGSAMASVQVVWQAGPAHMEQARRELERLASAAGAPPLQAAELVDVQASLEFVADDGGRFATQPRPASGTAANRVVFSEPLSGAYQLAAEAAFRGERGRLILRYQGGLVLHEQVIVQVDGDMAPMLRALAPTPSSPHGGGWFPKRKPEPAPAVVVTLQQCKDQVGAAFASGQLREQVRQSANASTAVRDRLVDELRDALAGRAMQMLQQQGAEVGRLSSCPVHLQRSEPESRQVLLHAQADLGDWFARHGGAGA